MLRSRQSIPLPVLLIAFQKDGQVEELQSSCQTSDRRVAPCRFEVYETDQLRNIFSEESSTVDGCSCGRRVEFVLRVFAVCVALNGEMVGCVVALLVVACPRRQIKCRHYICAMY